MFGEMCAGAAACMSVLWEGLAMLISVVKAGNVMNHGIVRPRNVYFGSQEQWLLLGGLVLVCFGVMFLMRKKPPVKGD